MLCHACQLGKHVRLPLVSSESIVNSLFDIVHSDLWTSPLPSISGIKYYVLFLDHFSHYVWVIHCETNLIPSVSLLNFVLLLKLNLKLKLKHSSLTMVVSSITTRFNVSLTKMASIFVSLVPEHLNKMANPSE